MASQRTLRKALLLLLMLLLPLQGIAAAYAPVHKALNPQATPAMPCHDHAQAMSHDASQTPDHGMPGATQDSDTTSHLCCHQVLWSAPVHVMPPAGARKFNDVSRLVLPLATLFIPDSPDRPPRG